VVFWVITRRRVCNYPKDHRLHQHRGGSLKSRFFSSVKVLPRSIWGMDIHSNNHDRMICIDVRLFHTQDKGHHVHYKEPGWTHRLHGRENEKKKTFRKPIIDVLKTNCTVFIIMCSKHMFRKISQITRETRLRVNSGM
jgi:hypothetical protein